MPWTFYRYILKDLLKLFLAATTVLVLVISFAAAVKPLSEGLLSPASLVKYLLFLAPTMLGYTIPFAGAFATTLVFTRLSSDNELVACRACGMSYRTILVPVFLLGLVLTLSLFYLSNWVVPSFYLKTATMLEKDLTQVLVRQVRQRRPVAIGDVVLYADAVDDTQPPPTIPGSEVQPSRLIRLRGVAAGRLDTAGRLRSDSTAERADLLLYTMAADAWVEISLFHVMYHDPIRGDLIFVEKWSVPPVRLPSPFRDRPRFLSWPQLRQLGRHPERFDRVRQLKRRLADTIASEQLFNHIENQLTQPRSGRAWATLLGPRQNCTYRLTAPRHKRVGDELLLKADGLSLVELVYYIDGSISRRIEAQSGTLQVEAMDLEAEPWARIELKDARVYDVQLEGRSTEHASLPSINGRDSQPLFGPLIRLDINALMGVAERQFAGAQPVQQVAQDLNRQIQMLFRKAVAQLHERAASAVACLLIILFSATLSMATQASTPLVVYFWSFMSAIVVIIITHSGENLATAPETSQMEGLAVMWAGNLLLTAAVACTYWRLRRA